MHAILSAGRRFGPVGLIYGGSILLLLLGELALSRYVSNEEFGAYQLVRQAVPFTVMVAVLGYDQALTRESAVRAVAARFDVRQGRISLVALVAGSLVGGVLHLEFDVPAYVAAALPLAVWGVTVSNLVSGVMRATTTTPRAAFGQQGHRLLAGAALMLLLPLLDAARAAHAFAAAAVAVAAWCLLWSRQQKNAWLVGRREHRHMRLLGLGYCLSMLTMALGDWADLALVAHLGGTLDEVGVYAQAKLLAVYPILSVGSILGFVALPMFTKRRDSISRQDVSRWMTAGTIGALLVAIIASPLTMVALHRIFDSRVNDAVVLLLICTGALRLFYVLPSALLGARASSGQLVAFGACSVIGLLVQLGVTLLLAGTVSEVATAAAWGLLAASIFRVLIATGMTFLLYRDKVESVQG